MILFLFLWACGTHTPVDVQVDVLAFEPDDAEIVKICVEDGPELRTASRDGDYVITGVPVEGTLTVDVLDEEDQVILRAGPHPLVAGWQQIEPADCEGTDGQGQPRCARACLGEGSPVDADEDSWSVAVTFGL